MAASAATPYGSEDRTAVITGALSYTGKYTTRLLLERGFRIRTLTNHPSQKDPFGGCVQAFPYDFDRPQRLVASLCGAGTLINTYWVRFPYRSVTYQNAVRNTQTLIAAARQAGVRRLVHVSIANPSLDSPLDYYRGKAQLEEEVRKSGLTWAILRPTVIFGSEDVLINNIAWFVRRFPVFGVPGNGHYGIQPIYVEDMARLLADAVTRPDNFTQDAAGPEAFTFSELVHCICKAIGRTTRIIHLPTPMAYLATRAVGLWVRDVVLTWNEYRGLMSNLLVSHEPPAGSTSLRQWLADHSEGLGQRYASELRRHFCGAQP